MMPGGEFGVRTTGGKINRKPILVVRALRAGKLPIQRGKAEIRSCHYFFHEIFF